MRNAARALPTPLLALAHNGASQAGPTAWLGVLHDELNRRGVVTPAHRAALVLRGYQLRVRQLLGRTDRAVRVLRAAGG